MSKKTLVACLLGGIGNTHPITMSALMAGYDPKSLDKLRILMQRPMIPIKPGEVIYDEAATFTPEMVEAITGQDIYPTLMPDG